LRPEWLISTGNPFSGVYSQPLRHDRHIHHDRFFAEISEPGRKRAELLNQAAFPVYILHQSVMMVIAYFVVQWQIGVGLQAAAIAVISLIASPALFELFKRFAPTRFILGIKAKG